MNRSYLPATRHLITTVAAVLVLLLIVGGAVIFGLISATNVSRIATIIPTPPQLVQSVAGLLLIGVGLYYIRSGGQKRDTATQLTSTESPPEQPQSPPKLIGAELDAIMDNSRDVVQLKTVPYPQTEAHELLYETAHTAITVTRAASASEAHQLLESGGWTTNTIAQGFLGNKQSYPITFQLIRWATPRTAYDIAIEQTIHAIVALLAEDQSAAVEATEDIDAVEPLQSVINDIQAAIDRQRGTVSAATSNSMTAAGAASGKVDDPSAVDTQTVGQSSRKEDN